MNCLLVEESGAWVGVKEREKGQNTAGHRQSNHLDHSNPHHPLPRRPSSPEPPKSSSPGHNENEQNTTQSGEVVVKTIDYFL